MAAEVPQLVLTLTSTPADKIAALRLISNSIAQQRQTLNSCIISHPYFLAPVLAFYAAVAGLNYARRPDLITIAIILAGITIVLLSIVSKLTEDYITEAERVGSEKGLKEYVDGAEKVVVVMKWGVGGKVIGAVVVRKGGERRAEVWGWSVELRYRGKGLGKDLLQKAVLEAREKWGEDCEVVLAEDHANSFRVENIPKAFNALFDKSEVRVRKLLQELTKKKGDE